MHMHGWSSKFPNLMLWHIFREDFHVVFKINSQNLIPLKNSVLFFSSSFMIVKHYSLLRELATYKTPCKGRYVH